MQDLGEAMRKRTEKLAGEIDRLGDAVLRTVERGLNVISAAIAFMFVAAVMAYVLGLVHSHNKHEDALAEGRACINSVAEVNRIVGQGAKDEKERLFLGDGRLLAGQQRGLQEVPRTNGQGGR